MTEHIADCAVSQPLHIPGVKAEADMGGLKFSSKIGLFYQPTSGTLPIKLPPPFEGER